MSIFVNDTFTGTAGTALEAHAGEIGAAWSKHPSYASGSVVLTAANRARSNVSNTVAEYCAAGSPASAEYDVQVDLTPITATAPVTVVGVMGQKDPTADTGYIAWYNVASNAWELYKYLAGTATQLGSFAQNLTAGTTYTLLLRLRIGSQKILINGTQVVSATDNSITAAGKAGIVMVSTVVADTGGVHLDNFAAADLAGSIPVTDANWQHTPFNTYLTGGIAAILCEGGSPATLKVNNTGNLSISVDVSRAVTAGLASGNYPVISRWLDGVALADFQLTPSTSFIPFLAGGTVGTHTISYVFRSEFCPAGDTGVSKWVPSGSPAVPPYAVVITGAMADAGAVSVVQALPTGGTDLVQGDSITETLRVNDANDTAFSGDATKGFATVIRQTYGSQLGQLGYGGTGYEAAGQGGTPAFPTASGLYFQGVSRLDGSGHYQPAPDRIWIVHGTNGPGTQADVAAAITTARGRAPAAQINLCVPPGGFARSAITAAVSASGDAKVALIDAGAGFQVGLTALVAGGTSKSADGIHPNAATHAAYGAVLVAPAIPSTAAVQLLEFVTTAGISLVHGNEYRVINGTELDFSFARIPDMNLSGATVEMAIGNVLIAGLVTGALAVRFQLLAAQTAALTATTYTITAGWDNGESILLAAGSCSLS